ncbi:serine/threonine-protein kinase RsbW [Catenulispora sp. GAS73]|uniref:ATP-binding protein n=1 Tax=Catenulispora sp. GAS73 TaxID=3156269 RepID=UPI003511C30B
MEHESRPMQALSALAPATGAIAISVPADPDYLAVVRSACAQVGAKLGWGLAEASDLRLAVDEACGLLLRHAITARSDEEDANLQCRFTVSPSTLRVAVSLRAEGFTSPDTRDFGWTIVTALVDDFTWNSDGPTARVEIVKHRAAAG